VSNIGSLPEPGELTKAVTTALDAASSPPEDAAAVQLIRRYAHLLDEASGRSDEADVYSDLGPKLLAALTALGLTLSGRTRGGVQASASGGSSKLNELRARRAQRAG